MAIDSEPRKILALPDVPPEVIFGRGGQNLLALQFQYVVTLANCNKTSIMKSSADS